MFQAKRKPPYTFKLPDNGQVTFTFMSADKADEYHAKLLDTKPASGFGKLNGEQVHKAVGMYYDEATQVHKIITIEYNPKTWEIIVSEVKEASKMKRHALNDLQIALVKNKIT